MVNYSFSGNVSGNVSSEVNITSVEAVWSYLPVVQAICSTASVLANSCLLGFILFSRLITSPFHIYIISLLTCNTLMSMLEGRLDVMNELYSTWWLGSNWCSAYNFSSVVLQALVGTAHLSIIVNRLWAVCCPVHYRCWHTKKVAGLIVAALSVVCVSFVGPLWLLDMVYYRLPELENGCSINAKAQWA